MTEKQMEWHERLRAPFPKDVVGKLPKPYKRDSAKGQCRECGGYHGLPAAHLDYVGHAAVTDRLLSVDPEWSWEPMAVDEVGLPALDRQGNLWIRLTIHGVTRIGVGDAGNGKGPKEAVGDAIRNGAMRFGVALDLWSKEELESGGKFDPVAPQHVSTPGQPQSGVSAEAFAPPQFSDDDQRAWLDSVAAQNTLEALEALWRDAQQRGAVAGVPGFQDAVKARKAELQAQHGEAA